MDSKAHRPGREAGRPRRHEEQHEGFGGCGETRHDGHMIYYWLIDGLKAGDKATLIIQLMKLVMKNSIIIGAAILAIVLASLGTYFAAKYWSSTTSSETEAVTNVSSPSCGDGVCQTIEKIKNTCAEDCLKAGDAEEVLVNSDATSEGFVVIHMEPGTGAEEQKNLANPKTYWPNLVSLVETADLYDIKLTLLFNPEWADYILQNPDKLSVLRNWEADGHEIGYHHHGPQAHGMNYWNGYTNQIQYQNRQQYKGTIDDAMNLLTQLPIGRKIYTAGVAGEEDRLFDWPPGVPYRVDGTTGGAVDSMKQETINNQSITFLQHQIFIPEGENSISLDEIRKEATEMKKDEYLGIVFHAHNFTNETKTEYEELFKFLSENLNILTVKDILT